MKFYAIFLILSQFLLIPSNGHPTNPKICNTPNCHQQSATIRSKMDQSASPCNDFYKFACGNYKGSGSTLADHQISNNRWIIQLASQPLQNSDDKLVRLIKIFYQSCLYEKGTINDFIDNGMSMRRSGGGHSNDYTWENIIQDLQFFQNTDAYIFSTNMDFVDEQILLVVDQPYFDTKAGIEDRQDVFYDEIVDFLVQHGSDRAEVEIMKNQAFKFEDKLLELTDGDSEAEIEVVTIAELQTVIKFINWTKYFQIFFTGSDLIDDNFVLGLRNAEVLKKIDNFLFSSSEDDILNYLVWRFLESAYISIIYNNNEELEVPVKRLNANNRQVIKCTTCLCKLQHELDVAVAAVYVRNFVTTADRQAVTDMIKSMKIQLFSTFKDAEWLDEKTKAAAARKLSAMKFYVGYPDILLDQQFLADYYNGLDFSGRSLIEIIDQISIIKNRNQRRLLTNPATIEAFFLLIHVKYIPLANALYSPNFNAFMISGGLFDKNFISIGRPQALNYGFIGYTIGHEIFHGFDNKGRLYDENGHANNWWAIEAENQFKDKSKCFVDQYGSYVEPTTGMNVNGYNTLSENIADNGGLMLAYRTYEIFKDFDLILPNLNMTSNQLFWMAMAQFHCSNYSYDQMKYLIESDSHSPGRFRVIGTMGNMKEFLNDFECADGSEMNRKDKCRVW